MKVVKTENKVKFQPVDLKITLESQEEVNALFCLFNHAWVVGELPISFDGIRKELPSVNYEEMFDTFKRGLDDRFNRGG